MRAVQFTDEQSRVVLQYATKADEPIVEIYR